MIRAYAAKSAGAKFEAYAYDPGALPSDEVEIEVLGCGICHSDLSMLKNEWGQSRYPFVGGHEVCGRVAAVGSGVTSHAVGEMVGLGWYSRSCRNCRTCLSGDHNLCPQREDMIGVRQGGFAERVRCQALWATKLPAGVDPAVAGPLFCGGITVFNPMVQMGVKPTDRVGVIGIGGLGHLALQFLNKWGCEVVAFTSSDSKAAEAKRLGAHSAINSTKAADVQKAAGTFDFIISTVNVPLAWDAYMAALKPKGRLHHVGAVLEPQAVPAFALIAGQKQVSGTPLGSPATTAMMLDFCARHGIKAQCETFAMSRINEAFAHLESGKARYRIVLEADFS